MKNVNLCGNFSSKYFVLHNIVVVVVVVVIVIIIIIISYTVLVSSLCLFVFDCLTGLTVCN